MRLVGRDVEIADLRRALDATSNGRLQIVVLEGEAGVGKSAVVDAIAERAGKDGFGVWTARADEMGRDRPFGPIVDALRLDEPDAEDDDRADLVRSLHSTVESAPSVFGSTVPELRNRVVDAVVDLMIGRASVRPTLLVIEDLHWVDSSIVRLVRAVQHRAMGSALFVLVTTRPVLPQEVEVAIDGLVDNGARHLRLGPLAPDAVAELARDIVGSALGPNLEQWVEGAAGNPLYIVELLRGALDEGLVNGNDVMSTSTLPRSLSGQVLRKIGQLSGDARGALRLAAVLGSRFAIGELAAASGRLVTELWEPVDEALRSGLLHDEGERLAFRHDLVRDAIYEQLPEPVRRGIHLDVARALARAGAPASAVAAHFSASAEHGDHEAVAWLRRAAREAMGTAPTASVSLLEKAIQLEPSGTAERTALQGDRVEALGLAGRLDDAEAAAADLVRQLRRPEDAAAIERLRGLVLLLRNRAADASEALERVSNAVDGTLIAETGAEAALAALVGGELDRAGRLAETALANGHRDAAPIGASLALTVLSRLASLRLELVRSLELAHESVRVAESDLSAMAHRYQPLLFLAMSHHDLDELDETMRVVDAGRRGAEQAGMTFAAPLFHGFAAFTHLRAGRVDEAAAEAEAGVVMCDETGSDISLAFNNALLALASLHLDDLETARTAIAEAERAVAVQPPWLGIDLVALARARLQEALGDLEGARAALEPTWQLVEALGARTMSMVIGADLARITAATGRREEADAIAAALDEIAEAVRLPSWRAAAAEAHGIVNADPDALVAAVELHRESPRLLARGAACERAASALLDAGRSDEAIALLDEAIGLFTSCDARRDRA
ncbi:MAG: hypothetical protein V7636_834, partial [Actinomycetota bacterium]